MTQSNDEEEMIWENAGHWLPPLDFESEEAGGSIEPLEPASRRVRGPVSRRIYTTGSPVLDKEVQDLLDRLGDHLPGMEGPVDRVDLDLTRELVTSAIRLLGQGASRDELKMVNAALKEFAYAFRVFKPYKSLRKVSIFGSARIEPGEESYVAARDFAELIADRGWMVITGAGRASWRQATRARARSTASAPTSAYPP